MADKLWAGRFSEQSDIRLDRFNSSITFDCRMADEDIEGSVAHAEMLGAAGIIGADEAGAIIDGLRGIQRDLKSGALLVDNEAEDIHMFIEAELTERIGTPGKSLHTARSRNDQVALDLRLYLRGEIDSLLSEVSALIGVLIEKAEAHLDTVMPGYTHLQRAQPVTFAHHLLAYVNMLLRDRGRLLDCRGRMNHSPLGSGALAATTYPIDRFKTAGVLGFLGPMLNSLDGVSDRDYCVELCSALSIMMTHLSRFCEEIILWCSWEFKFIELSDRFATGSSIMPQKKNPDIPELIRGKTGRVNGDLIALLTMLKALPLAYNKDMQEDKEAIFDAVDTALNSLMAFTPMIESMKVFPEKMRAAAAGGFINATDCADYLVKKGAAFRDAYRVTGSLVAACIERGLTLETLPIADYRAVDGRFGEDVYEAIKLENILRERTVFGGPAPEAVKKQLELLKAQLK